jgi:pyruvate dehydrogenase E2 component (dihydrolipoamide acetyltransferase)
MATKVIIPQPSELIEEVTIVSWLVEEGDFVNNGQDLLEIETEKATVAVQADDEGYFHKGPFNVGDTVRVYEIVAIIGERDEEFNTIENKIAKSVIDDSGTEREREESVPGDISQEIPQSTSDWVLEQIQLTGIRKTIFERMAASAQETSRVTLFMEVDATRLVQYRDDLRLKVNLEWGFEPGYNDLIAKIVASSLREFPYMNARLGSNAIEIIKPINIGMAVDTDRGLVVPVIRDADKKSIQEFGTVFRKLAERAHSGRLLPEDVSGGTFTITNLGMFDVDAFTPIINLPEIAILAVGRIKPTPRVVDNEICVRHILILCLSFDHRVVDGAPAARFLQSVKKKIEDPM